ncbi:MAG: tetratricopeptide repeat protein [Labilithrix sp.]|nr:tetratricopeptide repeat protein [Labilithrix sp.]
MRPVVPTPAVGPAPPGAPDPEQPAGRPADHPTVRLVLLALAVVSSGAAACATAPPLPPKALELNQTGAAALAAGDLATAEARLSVALEYSPRFTEAWVNLGYVELRRGNLQRARKHFVKARDLNPDLAAPHHALGLLADRRDVGKEAEGHYRQALRVDPGFVPARSNLARRLFQRGAFEASREQYLRLTQVAPDAMSGYLGLAECLLRLDREAEADDVVGRARLRFGDAPELVMLVARQLLRREAFAEAEEILAPLTDDADRPRASAAWAWIGVARLARGERAGARDAAREALALDRDNRVAAGLLAPRR